MTFHSKNLRENAFLSEGIHHNKPRQIISHYRITEALNLMQVIPFTSESNKDKEERPRATTNSWRLL